jgi:hypothetical protein
MPCIALLVCEIENRAMHGIAPTPRGRVEQDHRDLRSHGNREGAMPCIALLVGEIEDWAMHGIAPTPRGRVEQDEDRGQNNDRELQVSILWR